LRLEVELSGQLMLLGLPMAFQNFIIAIGSMIVQRLINSFGVIFIAGFTATNKLYGVLEIAATSYGFAMVTYTGQNLGANQPKRIREGLKAGVIIALITSTVLGAILILLGKPLLSLFISGTEEEISQTLAIAYHYLSIMSVCLPILYVLHVFRSTLQGLGDTVSPMLSGVAEFAMRTGCVLLLPLWLGAEGIFYAEVLAWTGADLVLIPSCIWALRHRLTKK
jgi:Na+-driven multidrug efflux pump